MSRPLLAVLVCGLAAGSSCTDTGVATTPPSDAEETFAFENPGGMWMPGQMTAHADTLHKLGVAFEPTALTDPTAFPLGAIVSLGGCSASFVSDAGLVITNHHCVTGALQYNSTPDENLLVDGFLAKSRPQERWAGPTARIYVTTSFRDVTDKVLPGLADIADPTKRYAALEKRTDDLEAACSAAKKHTRCRVASYFEGAQFFEIEQLEIRDVRLVYAPHAGVGVFGGEVDNWRWPRHTGDYSFLRAYVGPDGKPADHADANVPYAPPHRLKVAAAPLAPGDFAMVAGYPGRTYRLKTADEVAEAVEWDYPQRIARADAYIEALESITKANPALKIKAASRLRRLHNGRTNFQGMLDGLTKGGLLAKKRELEKGLRDWIDGDAERKAAYGDVLEQMAAASEARRTHRPADAAVREILRASALLGAGLEIWEHALRRKAGRPDGAELQQAIRGTRAMSRSFAVEIDRARLQVALRRAAALPQEQRPDELIAAFVGEVSVASDPDKLATAIARLCGATQLDDEATRIELLKTATAKRLKGSRDRFVQLARKVDQITRDVRERRQRHDGVMAALRPRYIAALRAFTDGPIAPDANGTLRLTFGTVRGYRPAKDADVYTPFTTVSEMVAKHTGQDPFVVPPNVLAAAKQAKDTGYADQALGDVPLDFLADLDITGGNSGSATLNATGELIGLAFDGNYESIASDWVFTPSVSRSIHVDIRYVLWLMDHVDGAQHLMKEMGVEPKAASPAGP